MIRQQRSSVSWTSVGRALSLALLPLSPQVYPLPSQRSPCASTPCCYYRRNSCMCNITYNKSLLHGIMLSPCTLTIRVLCENNASGEPNK